jgi:hypothetical protein
LLHWLALSAVSARDRMLQGTQHLSNISQLSNFVHRTICALQTPFRHHSRGRTMRTFANHFLSVVAAISISSALFSAALI